MFALFLFYKFRQASASSVSLATAGRRALTQQSTQSSFGGTRSVTSLGSINVQDDYIDDDDDRGGDVKYSESGPETGLHRPLLGKPDIDSDDDVVDDEEEMLLLRSVALRKTPQPSAASV